MKKIKLGMIGLSEGNGHPYSWSAILNGYNPEIMESCPFPVIPQYLKKEKFPDATIKNAEVTHIWTQDISLSHHIAEATYIPHIVENIENMISEVDGILLARDDANNHFAMAKPFLEAGLPIYIDKPLALTCTEVERIFSLQNYPGQIFTCSAFQYARELESAFKLNPNEISHIEAFIKKDWNKYAIHLIEPIIKIIGCHLTIEHTQVSIDESCTAVNYRVANGPTIQIKTFQEQDVKPTIHFHRNNEITTIVFADTFFAFKAALEKFITGIQEKKETNQKAFVLRCIEMMEVVSTTLVKKHTITETED